MERTGNEFDFRNTHVPFADYFTLELKPTMPIANQEKAGVYEKRGAGLSYIGGTWKHDQIKFSTRNFGEYVISTDMNPPTIAFLGKKGSEVSFKIGDDKSGIESINAYINGEWLLMKYDYKNRMIISERLDKSKPLHGDLQVEVVDKANNKKIYTLKL